MKNFNQLVALKEALMFAIVEKEKLNELKKSGGKIS
jgi:hypothetical protein